MKQKTKKMILDALTYVFLIALSGVCLLPLYWMVRSSLMKLNQIFIMPPIWFPSPLVLENYVKAMTMVPFGRYFINTIIIVVGGLSGTLITATMCGYAFARLQWPGRNIVFACIISSMMLPYAVTLIPTFLGWQMVGALDTFYPLVVPAWFGGGVFNIFLLRQFFRTIPLDLDEAALIDGANYPTILLKVIIPLTKPALIVVGLFTFMNYWNDFLGPLVYLNNEKMFTVSLGLTLFKGMYNAQWHLMMAASTVVIAPVLVVFFIGQKYFIEGIALTGMKG